MAKDGFGDEDGVALVLERFHRSACCVEIKPHLGGGLFLRPARAGFGHDKVANKAGQADRNDAMRP